MVTIEKMAAVDMALAASQEQVQILFAAIDRLRKESAEAVDELWCWFTEEQKRDKAPAGHGHKAVTFVNATTFEGGKFTGTKTEDFKIWSKKVKNLAQRRVTRHPPVLGEGGDGGSASPGGGYRHAELRLRLEAQREAL